MNLNNNQSFNLNKIRIEPNHKLLEGNVQPYFENLESTLVNFIDKSTYVIGCIAWLTNPKILDALEKKSGVKLIINKEEFLNSNLENSQRFYHKCLRGRYNELHDLFDSNCKCCDGKIIDCDKFKETLGNITTDENKSGAVLTCGVVNNYAKLHHKFLIFLDEQLKMLGVWTGSYNLSVTSNLCLENALYITDPDVINEYLKEFKLIYSHSEKYNWNSGLLFIEKIE
jgi:phosphatidylserine/phosphatidylglycerophosphate/cardiolipin synthase-like enzyme